MAKKNNNNGTVVAGYICSVASILILPIIFMPAGIVLGLINVSKNEIVHGIAQIMISIIFGFLGMFIGAWIGTQS